MSAPMQKTEALAYLINLLKSAKSTHTTIVGCYVGIDPNALERAITALAKPEVIL